MLILADQAYEHASLMGSPASWSPTASMTGLSPSLRRLWECWGCRSWSWEAPSPCSTEAALGPVSVNMAQLLETSAMATCTRQGC